MADKDTGLFILIFLNCFFLLKQIVHDDPISSIEINLTN